MTSLYTHYFFDFDYTLADSSEGIIRCFHLALEEAGYPQVADEVITPTIGIPMLDAVSRITGVTDETEKLRFLRIYQSYADLYMTPGTHFYPDTVQTLQELKRRGARIAIISSKTGHRILQKFTTTGTEGLIDLIIGSHDVKELKPNPEGVYKALAHFNAPKEAALYIGDSVTDAQTARNAGLDFAGIASGVTPREELEKFPHVLVADKLGNILGL